jgi:hypothetical protein
MGNDVAKSSHVKTVKKIRGDRKSGKEHKAANSQPHDKGAVRVKTEGKILKLIFFYCTTISYSIYHNLSYRSELLLILFLYIRA